MTRSRRRRDRRCCRRCAAATTLSGAGPTLRAAGRPSDRRQPGDDLIRARDGGRDRVDCGAGPRHRHPRRTRPGRRAARSFAARGPRQPASTTPQVTHPTGARRGRRRTADRRPGHPRPTTDPPTRPPTPPGRPARRPAVRPVRRPDDYPQLLAAGDIADCTAARPSRPPRCSTTCPARSRRSATSRTRPGPYEDFANCYDPTWGRHKYRTRPAVGNHEYETAGRRPLLGLLRGRRRRGRQGLVQLRPRRLARRRPEQRVRGGRRLRARARRRWSGCAADLAANPAALHRGVLAHPALQLGQEARRRPQLRARSGRSCTSTASSS